MTSRRRRRVERTSTAAHYDRTADAPGSFAHRYLADEPVVPQRSMEWYRQQQPPHYGGES